MYLHPRLLLVVFDEIVKLTIINKLLSISQWEFCIRQSPYFHICTCLLFPHLTPATQASDSWQSDCCRAQKPRTASVKEGWAIQPGPWLPADTKPGPKSIHVSPGGGVGHRQRDFCQ